MRIYLAGNPSMYDYQEDYDRLYGLAKSAGLYHLKVLASFVDPKHFDSVVDRRNELFGSFSEKQEIFLDSGAFSVWKSGKDIDIEAYRDFIDERIKDIKVAVNLDVIPSNRDGSRATRKQMDIAFEKGLENFKYLSENTKLPKDRWIHVFHKNDDYKYFERILTLGITYIGLAPGQGTSLTQRLAFLDKCMDYVTDSKGYPIVKFHGFAVTGTKEMLTYPWYSVDSTSWVLLGAYGKIMIPKIINGKYNYTERPYTVAITRRSNAKQSKGQHYENLTVTQRELVDRYVEELGFKYGVTEFKIVDRDYKLKSNERWDAAYPDGLSKRRVEIIVEKGLLNEYKLRAQLNAKFMFEVEARNKIEYFEQKHKYRKLFI
jgi:hypothetical protein